MSKSLNKFYTDTGVSIDQRIRDFKTKMFDNKLEAEAYAKQKRSSCYQVFDEKRYPVGWAVPK